MAIWPRLRSVVIIAVIGAAIGLALMAGRQSAVVADLGHWAGEFLAREPAVHPTLDHMTTDGRRVDAVSLVGQPAVVAFVFSHCPDVCPTTLADMAGWMAALGPDADGIVWYAVTLDPERDAPGGDASGFRDYIAAFDARIVALHADRKATDAAARGFRATHRKVVLEGSAADYTIDHSAGVYLIDANGRYRDIIGLGEASEGALGKLRRLLAAGS